MVDDRPDPDQPAVVLGEPMHLNRDDPVDFSPTEPAALHGLGGDRYDFRPTAPGQEHWRSVG